MNRFTIFVAGLVLNVFAPPSWSEAAAPPRMVALKAMGLTVSKANGGTCNIDIRDAEALTEETWTKTISLP